ncbi:MAG: hypothetical protein J2P45_03730 [Candidatus Dormibacteraeota bacterium]|nr:hypothetical protein [Candidatus Dormibacteraeota bacterium]
MMAALLGAMGFHGAQPQQPPQQSPPPAAAADTSSFQVVNGPDLARNPVDPAGAAINLNQTPAQAANSLNCTLLVPANPLSAQGLATPYQLGDGCTMANAAEQAFVDATILAPNGQVTVYNPLVVTRGTQPLVAPTAPTVPAGSQVIIETGFNGNNLVLVGFGATQGNCIDAFGNSIIAQTAACNASAFFQAANQQIAAGTLTVPAVGTASDGQSCQITRSFAMIDQDQSDNTEASYLVSAQGRTAQNTAANAAALQGVTSVGNGSDDGLLAKFLDPALGCTPFKAPDTTAPSGSQGSQALNELSARQNPAGAQGGVPALLPPNDPQLLVNGNFSIGKVNTYRGLTDQPLLGNNTNATQVAAIYCQNMVNLQPGRLQLDRAAELNFTSPVPAVGNNLANFMGNRLFMSFTNLNCQNFGLRNPVRVTVDGNQVAIAVTYNLNLTNQRAFVPGQFGGGFPGPAPGGLPGRQMNPAGM